VVEVVPFCVELPSSSLALVVINVFLGVLGNGVVEILLEGELNQLEGYVYLTFLLLWKLILLFNDDIEVLQMDFELFFLG
jgi:hypothetical protein